MSQRDATRLSVLARLASGALSPAAAAACLGLSVRQLRRLRRCYEREGAAGLRSRRCGRPAHNRLDPNVTTRAIALIRAHYRDFGPTFANEKLREHGLHLSTESLRSLMIRAKIWKAKARRGEVHAPRERRPYFGELIQIDGSHHPWFEDRAPRCVLLVFVDDATSALVAMRFVRAETTAAYFALVGDYLRSYGKPRAFYSDRHSIFYRSTLALHTPAESQFARAMRELGIELICAKSPQAKGRVERANGTLQDRLVKELRLRSIATTEAANAYLPEFIADYNQRFAKPAACRGDVHRPLASIERLDLILTFTEARTLSKNLTFQFRNAVYRVNTKSPARLRHAKVQIHVRLDGTLTVERKGTILEHQLALRQALPRTASRKELREPVNLRVPNPKKAHPPAADHPWKKYCPRPATPADISASQIADIPALR